MPAISFLPFLSSIPLGTRLITLTIILLSVIGQGLSYLALDNSPEPGAWGSQVPWLVLVPGKSIWYPWTFLTAGLVELGLFGLTISVISIPLACRYLERVWGIRELIKFSIITIVGSNIIAFGFSWLMWFVLGQQDALYGLPYHGLSGLQVGFLVAFTQLIPEHQVQLLGKFKVRVKSLPGIHLLISNVAVVVFGPSPAILIQFGFIVAWVYLRFFKLSENGEFRGDRSETFAFQYWFPPIIRPYVAILGNTVFKVAVKLRLVQAWDAPMNAGAYSLLPGPGGARAEAERRRALALKALDARLASSSPAPGGSSSATSPNATSSSTVPSANVPPAIQATTTKSGAEAKV
ncbi:hypothetical protein L486_01957 [Kwoniella mangroviensis CBS 10435]|uniref:Endoplasmic reticulum protein n=1 Tax=Kwoniella mangroviensis CBS 10435 TaxID=1331196 RepID=A0A1B9J3G0_9TREE|nr:uncharacterized protein I203_06510 [Kwoniella mangroviensis CBS 8507]OCF62289.1 hypothetical protein L486_01957 [Kwoniella mangroviensis CBS 10435]OCF64329.1 hypothetical protein I203_06510 [Kwoniella mangroviensis CBS 8507]